MLPNPAEILRSKNNIQRSTHGAYVLSLSFQPRNTDYEVSTGITNNNPLPVTENSDSDDNIPTRMLHRTTLAGFSGHDASASPSKQGQPTPISYATKDKGKSPLPQAPFNLVSASNDNFDTDSETSDSDTSLALKSSSKSFHTIDGLRKEISKLEKEKSANQAQLKAALRTIENQVRAPLLFCPLSSILPLVVIPLSRLYGGILAISLSFTCIGSRLHPFLNSARLTDPHRLCVIVYFMDLSD